MTTTIQSVDDIRSAFPEPTVQKIIGEPTYETIKDLHDILKSNAASIPSTLGGGNHGHLGLVLQPALYTVVTGNNFTAPNNPGATPTITAAATAAQVGAITRQFNANNKTFLEYSRTDQALKQLLLGAIEKDYVDSLRNMYTGYTTVTTFELLTHLYDTYGQISDLDLEDNERRMKTKYNANAPIDKLFKQIEGAEEYATTGNQPFTARQIVNTAFLLIFATGEYDTECKEWKRRARATQTWANFKTDFMEAYKNRREIQKLQQQGSPAQLFGANATCTTPSIDATAVTTTSTLTDVFSDTNEKISAIANATLESGTQVAFLAQENEMLKKQVSDMQTILSQMQETVQATDNPNSYRPPTRQYKGKRTARKPRGFDPNSKHYCWSHGLTRTPYHTSQTCREPEPGHIKTATFGNRKKGSNLRCHLAAAATSGDNGTEDE